MRFLKRRREEVSSEVFSAVNMKVFPQDRVTHERLSDEKIADTPLKGIRK